MDSLFMIWYDANDIEDDDDGVKDKTPLLCGRGHCCVGFDRHSSVLED